MLSGMLLIQRFTMFTIFGCGRYIVWSETRWRMWSLQRGHLCNTEGLGFDLEIQDCSDSSYGTRARNDEQSCRAKATLATE